MSRAAIAFTFYAVGVAAAIVVAYPRLFTQPGGIEYRGKPLHPMPHAAIRGTARVDASSPVTFEYRGDAARSGTSPEAFRMQAPTPAWTYAPLNVGIHDASKASPAVDDTGIYVGSDSSWFYAFDPSGALRWKFHAGSALRGIHSTAALDAQTVYFGAYNGTLYALRKSDGELAWALRLGDTIGSSPVIVGDSIYVAVETFNPPDGFVARVRRSTGDVVWLSTWLGEQSHSSPTIDSAHNLVLVGANSNFYRALQTDDGVEVWHIPTLGPVKDTGCLVDGVVYFTSLLGAVYAVRAADGHVLWTTRLPGHSRSSPTFAGGTLVLGDDSGELLGLDAATGHITWRLATGVPNMIGSATAQRADDNTWIVWTGCGPTSVCALRAATGEVVQKLDTGSSVTSVPTIFKGSLYIAADPIGPLQRFAPAP